MASTNIIIHPLLPEDIPTITVIHQHCFQIPWPLESFMTLMATQTPLGFKVVSRHQCVGFIIASVVIDEAEILTLAVDPPYQRQHWGQALLTHLIATLQQQKATKLLLEVDENNAAALAFYQKNEFVVTGTRKNYYHFPNRTKADALMMQRFL